MTPIPVDPASNGHLRTTDRVGPAPSEPLALRRMREALALHKRLEHERAVERAGGPKASRW